MNRTVLILLSIAVVAGALAYWLVNNAALNSPTSLGPGTPMQGIPDDGYGVLDLSVISFRDDAEANSRTVVPIGELNLVGEDLQPVVLSNIQGDRNLVLVILRGVPLCPFCSAQTSRLVSNYEQFTERGAEVVVVFPGTPESLVQLLKKAEVDKQELPFPILVDTQQETIRRLDIEADLAKPSTFIIDRQGRTQFAYVGAGQSDRPSIAAVLSALDRLAPVAEAATTTGQTAR